MHPKTKYPRPPLSLIQHLPGWGVDLYVGDSRALVAPQILGDHGVTTVVNCAVNLDVNLVTDFAPPPDGTLSFGHGRMRYYKIGLIDGNGNPPDQMIGAYFILRAALDQVMPDRASYPNRARGNVLVNCRGGRSRSVTLVALFLALEMPDRYPTLEAAIAHIRDRRALHPDEWHEAPKASLIAAAQHAARQIGRMREPA